MNTIKALWEKYGKNPVFVTAYSLLGGALGKELFTRLQGGSFDWSLQSLQAMVSAAVSTTVVALIHLYMQSPNAAKGYVAVPTSEPGLSVGIPVSDQPAVAIQEQPSTAAIQGVDVKKLIPIVLAAASFLAVGLLTGCSQQTEAELLGAVGNSIVTVLDLAGLPTEAADAKTITPQLVSDVSNWQKGDSTASIVMLANQLEADAEMIPGESPYQYAVAIAVGTLDAFLSRNGAPAVVSTELAAHTAKPRARLSNPPKTAKQYRQMYNASADAHGLPAKAKI